jgi:hypothetical protein
MVFGLEAQEKAKARHDFGLPLSYPQPILSRYFFIQYRHGALRICRETISANFVSKFLRYRSAANEHLGIW